MTRTNCPMKILNELVEKNTVTAIEYIRDAVEDPEDRDESVLRTASYLGGHLTALVRKERIRLFGSADQQGFEGVEQMLALLFVLLCVASEQGLELFKESVVTLLASQIEDPKLRGTLDAFGQK